MKTTVKNSGSGYAYQRPNIKMMQFFRNDIICASPVGTIQDLTPETDSTNWEDLY